MGMFDWITGSSKNDQLEDFVSRGAKIIDVRSEGEFNSGHANHSTNIPLGSIQDKILKIKKLNSPIIVVCKSGGRASMALSILKKNGIEAINAGSWTNVS